MTVSNEYIKSILKTLPIGYYLGQNIDVETSEVESTSFFDPKRFKIVISTRVIQKGLMNCNRKDEIETIVRSMLYHEISHVILTPKDICFFPSYLNVFEDERIETKLSDYYLNVDFKWTVKTICKTAFDSIPLTADEYWFKLCRFRQGKQSHVETLERLLKTFMPMNVNTDSKQYHYEEKVKEFYEFIKKCFEDKKLKIEQQDSARSKSEKDDCSVELDGHSKQSDLDSQASDKKAEKTLSAHDNIKTEILGIVDDMTKSTFDKNKTEALKEIFVQMNKKKGRYGGNIQTYSGIFNYRQVTRKDCKFFVQTNRQERSSIISKTKLNLFIDGSGSYRDNLVETNMILKSLEMVEKEVQDFEFDLICLYHDLPQLQEKSNRRHSAYGGSRLGRLAKQVYRKVQDKSARNINILLLDGEFGDIDSANFDIFNKKDVIIISDSSNRYGLEKHCKLAMKTFLNSKDRAYSSQLFKCIVSSLKRQLSIF